jgi:asparagine synthetase B (glutamine-hydrolysing)
VNGRLPPLANLFAFSALDPGLLGETARLVAASGRFERVWRPHPTWVAASAPLPLSKPDDDETRRRGYAFAEGGHRIVGAGDGALERLERVTDLLDEGGGRLASLNGDFGFIHFSPDGSARVVRSCGGLVPFYLWSDRSSAAVATLLTDHARFLPGELRLDPLVHATWITGWGRSPNDRSFLAGVSLLPRGHLATVSPTSPTRRVRYWDPRPDSLADPTPERAREHAARLRTLLLDQLSEDLDPAGGNHLSLSGGIDSSSLAALATRTLGLPITTLSLIPEHGPERERELSYIEPTVEHPRVERHYLHPLSFAHRAEYLLSAPEAVIYIHHPALCLLPEISQEAGVRVLFGGEFADEICGSWFTVPDWDLDTSLVRLLRTWPSGPLGRRYPLRWLRSRLRDLARRPEIPFPERPPDLVRRDLCDEYVEWRARQKRESARDRRPRRHMALRLNTGQSWMEMNWEAASLVGVRRSVPFVTRGVLELAFSCHPAELVGPRDVTKKLIKAALAGDVPHRNLHRPDRGHFEGGQPDRLPWRDPLPERLGEIVRPDWVPTPPPELDPFDFFWLRAVRRTISTFDRLRSARKASGSVEQGALQRTKTS